MRDDVPSPRDEVGGIVRGKLWGILAARGGVCFVLGDLEDKGVPCALLEWWWSDSIEVGVSWNEGLFLLLWLREGDHVLEVPRQVWILII